MTSRALISIGCNNYLYCHSLRGAETDAKRVFEKLIAPQVGDYDLDSSCLLLSPTLSEVQTAIMRILFGSNSIDTFTVFFAGHGNIKAGSFYMCLKDSRSDALSATALSLSDLFLKIGEARPNQSNIIIDACESGGLIADLNVILKPELLGKSGTPGVTLLAATAGDQFASETAEGGIATTALLSCIEGNTFIQDLTSTLDLIEIGRKISSDTGGRVDQTPIVWGLNLYGPPRFCRNPHFHPGNAASLRGVLSAWPASTDAPVERHMSALWDLYLTVDRNWSPRSFRAILDPVLSDIASSPHNLVTFVERLSAALGERADLSNDRFRSTEVVAACSVALLAHSEDTNGLVASKLQNTILKVIEFGGRALTSAVTRLKADRYALLPERGGFADLFYLPCRISRLIGWGGTVVHLSRRIGMRHEDVERCFTELLDLIIEHYSTSVTAMTDGQAPFMAMALTAAAEIGALDQGEVLASLMFNSLVSCKAKIASEAIDPSKVLQYLLMRERMDFSEDWSLVAQPSELLTVVLKCASLFELEETFDDCLSKLDHVSCAVYVPADFNHFGAEYIPGGENAVYRIGHGVWRITDLEAAWPSAANRSPTNEAAYGAAIFASLIFPDRVPWFVFGSGVSSS